MARVYDTVKGMPGGTISRTLENGEKKLNIKNSVQRVVALHEDVQDALVKEGMKVFQRAQFRLAASQQKRILINRERVRRAIADGNPVEIARAKRIEREYLENKTEVTWEQADIDFHISMFRGKGDAFYAGDDNEERRDILVRSLTH